MAREIIHAGLHDTTFIERGTTNFEAYRAAVEPYTLEFARARHGNSRRRHPRRRASVRQGRSRDDLLDARHHRAPQRGRQRARADQPLRCSPGTSAATGAGAIRSAGRTTCRAAATWARCRTSCPDSRTSTTTTIARSSSSAWGRDIIPTRRLESHRDDARDGRRRSSPRSTSSARIRRSPTPTCTTSSTSSRASITSSCRRSSSRRRRRWRTSCLPAAATWAEGEGTVTNSERRVQRCPQGRRAAGRSARRDLDHVASSPRAWAYDWGHPTAEDVWNEVRALSPQLAGMSYARLEALDGIQWPCPDESHPGTKFLHARLWDEDPAKRGRLAPFSVVHHEGPVEQPDDEYPLILTTGPPARVVQHRRADAAATRRRCTAANRSTCRRKTPSDLGVDARRHRARDVASRHARRAGVHRSRTARRRRVHDAAFPRRRRDEPAHDQRDRPEVRHRRVQGVRGARRAGAHGALDALRRAEPLAAAGDD